MTDNDDYMVAKATDDTVVELMWDRLQEGINANRRYRLKQVGGGGDFTYATGTLTWTTTIYIFFTRESDGGWVYNTIAAGNKSGLSNNDILYVTLNDTTTTVLTVTSAAYGSMPTDGTGRILILGGIIGDLWSTPYFGVSTYDSDDFDTDFTAKDTDDLSEGVSNKYLQSHDNTYHSPNYATETALSSHETSTGTSHTYIGQDVSSTASPGWVKIYMSVAANANSDTDKFCCIDSGGEVKYRTGSELLSDIAAVGLSGAETIAGIKTFSSIPVLPASDPTTDNQAVRKAYADKKQNYNTWYPTIHAYVGTDTQFATFDTAKVGFVTGADKWAYFVIQIPDDDVVGCKVELFYTTAGAPYAYHYQAQRCSEAGVTTYYGEAAGTMSNSTTGIYHTIIDETTGLSSADKYIRMYFKHYSAATYTNFYGFKVTWRY